MVKGENIKIKFPGMTFECTNPGKVTILIMAMVLIFFLVLAVLVWMFKINMDPQKLVGDGISTISGLVNLLKR